MRQILQLTSDAQQLMTFDLDDGSSVSLSLYFSPMQLGWFIREISYNDFVLDGVRICNSPNFLHQYRNQIPFGIACISMGDREPSLQQDFSSTNSKLYVLTEADLQTVEDFFTGE